MYNEEYVENLIQNFEDTDFQKELKEVRNDLSNIFIDLIEYIKKENLVTADQLIISAPEARIKTGKSLKEKIIRKKYYDSWPINSRLSSDECRDLILEKLPDTIGLRINCYFYNDENELYKIFLEKQQVKDFLSEKNIQLTDDKKVLDDEIIYKYNGIYEKNGNNFRFELQLKSLVHSMWGEVDHRTIYKELQYDVNRPLKKKIELGIFDNLKNSNTQLLNIYTNSHTAKDLLKALFFEYTKDQLGEKLGIKKVQSRYYYQFYNIFHEDKYLIQIKKYIGARLIETTYNKIDLPQYDFTSDSEKTALVKCLTDRLKKLRNEKDYSYTFENLFIIINLLFSNTTEQSIIQSIASIIINDKYVKKDYENSKASLREASEYEDDDDIDEDDNKSESLETKAQNEFVQSMIQYFDNEIMTVDRRK